MSNYKAPTEGRNRRRVKRKSLLFGKSPLLCSIVNSRTEFCKHEGSCFCNVLKGIVKGGTIGFCIKASIGFLLRILKTKDPLDAFKNIFNKDTAGFTLFFALLPSLYKLSLCILRNKRGNDDKINSIIAGILSSLAAFVDQNPGRRKILIYYIFARAFYSAVMMVKHHEIAPVPKNWGLYICIFMLNVLTLWIFYEWDVVPKSIYNIVSKRAGQSVNDRIMVEYVFREKGKL
ncbi:unnamed protein product [Moneuplotes crassus]|uniref:Peroxisomal membrane protein 4 n=1 Tax=Euplotes crassus TaxID=5936 RepID=A0AAD1XPU9_EUPCR|nr:unnamed protein product [Moneuplotes crassus]